MNKIPGEQIKEFWGKFGFKLKRLPNNPAPFYVLNEPDGEQYDIWYGHHRGDKLQVEELYPDIDLINLFKYGKPILLNKLGKSGLVRVLTDWIYDCIMYEKDPATSLFLVIQEIIHD